MMQHRLSKNIKIIDELIEYLYKRGCQEMNLDLKFKKSESIFIIRIQKDAISPKCIDRLEERLNIQRCYEVEENFWELTGDSEIEGENELVLTGMMIDKTELSFSENTLEIKIKRLEK